MNLTTKQRELMRVIAAGDEGVPGAPVDLDQILERVRYLTTKASLQFSIRALVKHGLIEKLGLTKRRGRVRQEIQATPAGIFHATPTNHSAVEEIVSLGEDLDLVPETLVL